MANEQDNLEKSQEPTPKRQEEARKKGQVVRVRALIPSVGLLGATVVLSFAGETLMVTMSRFFTGFLTLAGEQRDLSASELVAFASHSGGFCLPYSPAVCGSRPRWSGWGDCANRWVAVDNRPFTAGVLPDQPTQWISPFAGSRWRARTWQGVDTTALFRHAGFSLPAG